MEARDLDGFDGHSYMDMDHSIQTVIVRWYRVYPGIEVDMLVGLPAVEGTDQEDHFTHVPDKVYWDEGFETVWLTEEVRLGRELNRAA